MEHFQQCQFSMKILNELARELYEEDILKEPERCSDLFMADSGYDLFFCEDTTIPAGETILVGLGVAVAAKYYAPKGSNAMYYPTGYRMLPRSSIYKTPLMLANSEGVIDPAYRGELRAPLWNKSGTDYTIRKGQRLIQLVATNMVRPKVKLVEELSKTKRGSGGFGSTGK